MRRTNLPLVLVAAAISAVAAIPVAYIVLVTLSAGFETMGPLIFRPRVGELLLNTAALLAVTVPLSAVLGVSAAYLVARTVLPGRRLLSVLLAGPLAIPAFVASYGWVTVNPSLAGLPAGILIATLSYFPLFYLPVAATLRRLDPGLEEIAASLGYRPDEVVRHVVLPQLRLPILGGALLVGLHLLAEYGAFAMIRFETFTTAIVQQYQSTFNGVAAAALATVLSLACLLLLRVEGVIRGRIRYSRIGSGAPRPGRRFRLGRWTVPAVAGLASLVVLSVGVPILSVGRWLLRGGATVWTEPHLLASVGQTLGFALAGATLTTLLALPVAILVVRHPSAITRVIEATNYVTSALPGIVIALALATLTIRLVQPLYQTAVVLLLAYVFLFLPRALVNLRAGIAQVPVGLEEAARSLGRHPAIAFVTITGRLAAPTALAGGALVFLGIVNELTATLLLGPNGTRTLTIQFWTHVNDLDYAQAAPYALLMMVLSMPMVFVLFRAAQTPSVRG